MYTVQVEKECGCFRRSDLTAQTHFETKDDALINARRMEEQMNQEFCSKHLFTAIEDGENIVIKVTDKPREASAGGCCGGGHCS